MNITLNFTYYLSIIYLSFAIQNYNQFLTKTKCTTICFSILFLKKKLSLVRYVSDILKFLQSNTLLKSILSYTK